ncbi:hypothetical protein [Nannocystis pusilla]|uniref:Receptor L-domain domain-containing protein n=1 Tax=Nannocystis pusilla TaxID=889268 RepID=A0ABS7TYZ1_9BACT|nr:hypothetical protein [Nannocystis pusilla]MBZ5713366.1 hypothetical protein [Nannocystis pusilla]
MARLEPSLLALHLFVAACGDDPAQGDAGGSSTEHETTSAATTSEPTTGEPEPCSRVHDGDLVVWPGTDLASLEDIGHVRGDLRVLLGDDDQRDLSFLKCLHTIDGSLDIQGTTRLESTEGLENLQNVQSVLIVDNTNLRTAIGFARLRSTVGLTFHGNPAAESIRFDALEALVWMRIGFCADTLPAANNLALADLAGFAALTTIERLMLEGSEALAAAELLDALAANGDSSPLLSATIRHSPLLSEESVHQALDALCVAARDVCGNAAGDPMCVCLIGG